jgi:hypothetical protein
MDAAAIPAFLREELANLQASLQALADGQLDLITVAPNKPRDGMFRFAAAGVLGVSAGFYGFYAGSWKFLG